MLKRKWFAVVLGVILITFVCTVGYMAFKALQGSIRKLPPAASAMGDGAQTMPDWVPFAIDNSPELALEGFLYEGKKVETASAREAVASGNNVDKVTGQIKEKVSHYPFGQIPLILPDILTTADEKVLDENIAFGIIYYTSSTVEEALAFYRKALGSYEQFAEDKMDASTGKTYSMSFVVETEEKFKMNATVMVMEMPETTGYTCGIYVQAIIRGAAKKEMRVVGIREDGVPENYPDKIVPIYKMKDIYTAEGDSEGCFVQYSSEASYKNIVDYYRSQLKDKVDFKETSDNEGEVRFYGLAPGWEIYVGVIDSGGYGDVDINCYVK